MKATYHGIWIAKYELITDDISSFRNNESKINQYCIFKYK
jgi:hypothetical protein